MKRKKMIEVKQILCFGDSNTYGLIPGTTERYGWNTRWTGILDEKVREKGYRVIEEGLCGRTTVFDDPLRDGRRGTELLFVLLETHKPIDMVVLMLGTNDCKMVYDASAEVIGYYGAVTPQIQQAGNRLSGLTETACASLLA